MRGTGHAHNSTEMKMNGTIRMCCLVLVLAGVLADIATAQPTTPVAAMVDDQPIFVSQVDWLFQKKFGERKLDPEVGSQLRAHVLKQLVEQQLVVGHLQQAGQAASEDEINLEVQRMAARLATIDKSLHQFLADDGQTMAGLKFNLRFQTSWKRYLDQHLTDENLEKFFQSRRRQFDGTQLRVAHLLIAVDDSDTDSLAQAIAKAESIVQQMEQGELAWPDAVAQHSTAPTRDRGGDVGWIGFSGPMPRAFTDVAFQLEVDQISPPVRTGFGVHVIKCLEEQRGTANWYDVRRQLEDAATRYLFDRLVNLQLEQSEVRYTGLSEYHDPRSGELTVPSKVAPDK